MITTIDNLFKSPTDKVFKKDSDKEEKEIVKKNCRYYQLY